MGHTLLLDTSSLTYRAFFALPATITGTDGRPVNAVRGYLDMTAQLIREHRPDDVVHVFDHDWRPAERVAAYDGYKGQRAPDPDGLPEQFDVLADVLDALGATRAWATGWEADDAIATLATAAAVGDRVDVVTGDRDLLQLVHDGGPVVRVLFTVKGVRQLGVFDEAAVRTKYGVAAQRYADFATLRGDTSDGLPGVRGIGEKTARDLVNRYPSIPDLLAHVDDLRPGVARNLRASRAYLDAMRSVVPVRRDVEVTVMTSSGDAGRLEALAQRHRLDSPLQRLQAALSADAATVLRADGGPHG